MCLALPDIKLLPTFQRMDPDLQIEFERYWLSIENETRAMLQKVKHDLQQRGLPFTNEIKESLLKLAIDK